MTLISCEQLWADASSRNFIKIHYPWFLSTYDGYKFPVQRVDALRYLLMLYYGGIYIDLENVSGHSLIKSDFLFLKCFLSSFQSPNILISFPTKDSRVAPKHSPPSSTT